MLQSIVRGIGDLSLTSICLLHMWLGMRDWRRFFRREPLRPTPSRFNRLVVCLWVAAMPWAIVSLIQSAKDFLHGHSQNTKFAWFVLGFLAFCYLISLAARYLPSAGKTTASE